MSPLECRDWPIVIGGCHRSGKSRWADKAPENVLYLAAWERLLGHEWLMVQVGRNPLDTIASMREAEFSLTLPRELDDLTCLMEWLGEPFDGRRLTFNDEPRGEGLEDPKIAATFGVHAASAGCWRSRLAGPEAADVWEATHELWTTVDHELRRVQPP